MGATRHRLPGGRWHFQHGPIDIVLQAFGEAEACQHAVELAWLRFQTVLPELVSELPLLRQPVASLRAGSFKGVVAQRMRVAAQDVAWAAHDGFVTPMAAVAGSVPKEVGGSNANTRPCTAGSHSYAIMPLSMP